MNTRIQIFAISFLIYIVSATVSYFIFSNLVFPYSSKKLITTPLPEPQRGGRERIAFDETKPRTESCPLNGSFFSREQRFWWDKHRPLGIMIENHKEARPQSGIYYADVLYEAVAEGGITRLLALFYCQDAGIVGPVRSARTYFLDFVSEYGDFPLYAHVGGANTPGPADALSQIEKYGWQSYNDLNQFSIGFPTFWRDYDRLGHAVATEHTMYSTTQKLWEYAGRERGLTDKDKKGNKWDATFAPYSFKDDASESVRPANQSITFNFWNGYQDYQALWQYDRASNSYLRLTGGEKHTDFNNKKQLSAKNVVILFMREGTANDGYENNLHLLYGTKGSGKATVFLDGKRIDGTWNKKERTSRTRITDTVGREIEFDRGVIWFEILPTGMSVTVQ